MNTCSLRLLSEIANHAFAPGRTTERPAMFASGVSPEDAAWYAELSLCYDDHTTEAMAQRIITTAHQIITAGEDPTS